MKRRHHFSQLEIIIAVGVVGLIGYVVSTPASQALFRFLYWLPWNP